jgi:hypothetical protein
MIGILSTMAINQAAVQAIANKTFQEPLRDWVNRANPVLQAMTKRAVSSDKIYIKGTLSTSHAAGPVADGSAVTFAGTEGTTYAAPTLDWSTYIAKFAVNKRAMEAMQNQPGVIGNLLQTEIQNAAKDLADQIAGDIFAGAVANGLVGMQAIIDNGNTYAGVDRSSSANANFRATVLDVGTESEVGVSGIDTPTELSTNILYQADELFFAANGYGFTEQPGRFTGVTQRQVMTKYKQLMENIDLAALGSAHFVNQANASGMLGMGSVGFAGVPFIRDRNVVAATADAANSGRLYILDMNYIDLAVLEPNPQMSLIHQVQGYRTADTTDGIRTYIEFMGNTGEVVQGYVKAYVQLASPDPKRAGLVIKNVKAV